MAEHTWTGEAPGTIVPDGATSPRPRAPGVHVGPFELVRRLGEGATGEVWEAVDRRIDAPVALKLFAPVRGAAPIARVMAEARASSRVVSDHVVYVREAGEIGGTSYIAMALCREETASDAAPQVARALTEEAPRSLAEAVAWGEQIARGVAAAHAVGVFHRDLKPDNVLVLPSSRKVRIADFGLAPLQGAWDGAADGPLTVPAGQEGPLVAGTPQYMAPEQARGFRRAPDPRRDAEALAAIDVYGVGATLWALLAGRPPRASVDGEPVERVRARAAMPLPSLGEVETRFRVPARLARIVERATSTDPRERYPSAEALAVDLAKYRAGRPTSLDGRWSPIRAALWARRNPARLAVAAWLVAMLGGLGAVVAVHARWEVASAELAELETALAETAQRAREMEARADQVAQRADAAADAAFASARRAETAEEHAEHLRRYAAREAERAAEAEAAELEAREAEAEARASEAEARAAEAEARDAETDARAAADRAREAEHQARDAEDRARLAEAEARAAAGQARAGEAEARAAEAKAQAEARASEAAAARAIEEAAAATARAEAAEAEAAAHEAARRAAEARAEASEARALAAERALQASAGGVADGG